MKQFTALQASCVRAIEARDTQRSSAVLAAFNSGSAIANALAGRGHMRLPRAGGFALVATESLPPQGLRHNVVALLAPDVAVRCVALCYGVMCWKDV